MINEEIVYIDTPFIKLDSLLKYIGIAQTGGIAKLLVQNEKVALNGQICTQRGKKIYHNDVVSIDDNYFKIIKK